MLLIKEWKALSGREVEDGKVGGTKKGFFKRRENRESKCAKRKPEIDSENH